MTSCASEARFRPQNYQASVADSIDGFFVGQKLSGISSYYADKFHGRKTANGETYDMYGLTAAHKELPFGSIIMVTNILNKKSVQVRINDRGPFKHNRILDLSYKAAQKIDLVKEGTADVEIHILKLGSE